MEELQFRKIFGRVELNTLFRKIRGEKLTQMERNYLSRSIRPKLRAILLLSRLNLLSKINRRTQKASREEILYNLSHYGYSLISLKPTRVQKIIHLENLIIDILIYFPESRFIEGIPFLLLKNKINPFKLIELATEYHLKNEIGYLIDTAMMIKPKRSLKALLNHFKKSKDKEERILGAGFSEKMKDFLIRETPKRMRSWNLLGRFLDEDFKKSARGYL